MEKFLDHIAAKEVVVTRKRNDGNENEKQARRTKH